MRLFSVLVVFGSSVFAGPVNNCSCPQVDCTAKATLSVRSYSRFHSSEVRDMLMPAHRIAIASIFAALLKSGQRLGTKGLNFFFYRLQALMIRELVMRRNNSSDSDFACHDQPFHNNVHYREVIESEIHNDPVNHKRRL